MVQIREVGADGWQAMRDIRLAALRDAPDAFASTYEREAAFAEADWQRRIASRGNFLAYAPELGTAPAGPTAPWPGVSRCSLGDGPAGGPAVSLAMADPVRTGARVSSPSDG